MTKNTSKTTNTTATKQTASPKPAQNKPASATASPDKTAPAAPKTLAEPMFALGLDDKDKPRGARFVKYNDQLVSAVLDMGLSFVIEPSSAFAEAAKKLPEGRHYSSGKAFIPDIKQSLLDELIGILAKDGDTSHAYRLETKSSIGADGKPEPRCTSPITSGLPRSWDEVNVGHMVLAHESFEDGWWEAIVIKREDDILTMRFRDAPKLPIFTRHVMTVGLVNPGPSAKTI